LTKGKKINNMHVWWEVKEKYKKAMEELTSPGAKRTAPPKDREPSKANKEAPKPPSQMQPPPPKKSDDKDKDKKRSPPKPKKPIDSKKVPPNTKNPKSTRGKRRGREDL
jgi:hypothetical protein